MGEPVIISRKDAKAAGLLRYFTGKPCSRGHLAERYVSSFCCVECNFAKSKEYRPETAVATERRRRWVNENRDHHRATRRAWYAKNADAQKEIQKRLRQERKEQYKAARDLRRAANPEKYRQIDKSYRERNAEIVRTRTRNIRARRALASGEHTKNDILDILAKQRGKCCYCKRKLLKKYDADHITPLSAGGENGRRNIQIACVKCNRSKGAKDPIEFAQSIGLLI